MCDIKERIVQAIFRDKTMRALCGATVIAELAVLPNARECKHCLRLGDVRKGVIDNRENS